MWPMEKLQESRVDIRTTSGALRAKLSKTKEAEAMDAWAQLQPGTGTCEKLQDERVGYPPLRNRTGEAFGALWHTPLLFLKAWSLGH